MARPQFGVHEGGAQDPKPQGAETQAPKRYRRSLTPEFRALIAGECRALGSQQCAKKWNLSVALVVECRVEQLEAMLRRVMATVERQRDEMARLERRAA